MKAFKSVANHEVLLQTAYEQLGFAEGQLLAASKLPEKATASDRIKKGGRLALAEDVGAERVFFVGQNYE